MTGTWAAWLQPSPHDMTSCDDRLCPDKELDPERPGTPPTPHPPHGHSQGEADQGCPLSPLPWPQSLWQLRRGLWTSSDQEASCNADRDPLPAGCCSNGTSTKSGNPSCCLPVASLCSCHVCAKALPTLWPHGLEPAKLLCPLDYPGKNTAVGCHALLQGIFLTRGSNLSLLHLLCCRVGSSPLVPPGKTPGVFNDLFLRPPSPLKCDLLNVNGSSNSAFSSVMQSCPTLETPWTAARQASLSITNSRSLLKLMSIESMMPSNHLIQPSDVPFSKPCYC